MVYLLCIDTRVTLQEYRPIYTTHYNCNVYYQHFYTFTMLSVSSLSHSLLFTSIKLMNPLQMSLEYEKLPQK